jgi:hypothetical protein
MTGLDLTDDEERALITLQKRAIDEARFPYSPRLAPLKAILAKLVPPPVREPLPAAEGVCTAARQAGPAPGPPMKASSTRSSSRMKDLEIEITDEDPEPEPAAKP